MRLPRTVDLLKRGIAAGEQAGVQLCVSLGSEVVAEVALGEARPGLPMTAETIVPWMSAGKPITAAAILRLVERGDVGLDDPVARHLPEFTGGGRDAITLRHVLTHTAGLHGDQTSEARLLPRSRASTPASIPPPRSTGGEESEARLLGRSRASAPPQGWTPGERAAYDPRNGWALLGEIVARIEGSPFPRAIRSVLDDCEMPDAFCGIDDSDLDRVRDRLGVLYERSPNGLVPRMEMIEPPHVTVASPGGNLRGPVREIARFYEHLRRALGGERGLVLQPESVAQMTARHREGMFDETFRQTLDWGLGVIVDSQRYGADPVAYGFGPHASERTFGHGGVQSSIGFCDPEHGLVVAWVANGQIGEPRHQRRNWAINATIYEDLGLDA